MQIKYNWPEITRPWHWSDYNPLLVCYPPTVLTLQMFFRIFLLSVFFLFQFSWFVNFYSDVLW